MTREWLLQLRPHVADPVEPSSSPATVAAAEALLGRGPTQWALCTADAIADEIMEQMPEHDGGHGALRTLRRSTESLVLAALRHLLYEGVGDVSAMTEEALEGDREFARRGIPLDRVLRGIRLGHAHLAQELTAAVERYVGEDRHPAELRRLNELLCHYADAHAGLMAEEYIAERDRWRGSDEAARRHIVDDIVAGRRIDEETSIRRLRYDLTRTHVAAILWCDHSAGPRTAADRLHRLADQLARTAVARELLTVPVGEDTVWLWLALPADADAFLADTVRAGLGPFEGLRLALGPPAHGPAGMRRSHMGAREAERMARLGRGDWVCDYREVRLAALASADQEHARWFVPEILGPLASRDSRMRELRETLRVYLATERSLRCAADRLLVARSTVTHRVRRAEELLPTSTRDNPLELLMALELARTLPDTA
ncbi:helix-turn-helix domain-containing protein [Streptomyces sp. NPDC051776]|uniref:PucR family transcriptional regulator n=1 Tax=Streptomyces sp. NPDC051776 TaxID=3155414 RepID=UPI0034209600